MSISVSRVYPSVSAASQPRGFDDRRFTTWLAETGPPEGANVTEAVEALRRAERANVTAAGNATADEEGGMGTVGRGGRRA